MLAGLLLGGKKSRCGFIVSFDDGRTFLAAGDHKTWLAIKGAVLSSRALPKSSLPKLDDAPLPPMPLSGKPIDLIEWTLARKGWEFRQQPKEGAQRFTVFRGTKGTHSLSLAFTPDFVTVYSLDQIASAFDRFGAATQRLIVAESIGWSAERRAKQMNVDLSDSANLDTSLLN